VSDVRRTASRTLNTLIAARSGLQRSIGVVPSAPTPGSMGDDAMLTAAVQCLDSRTVSIFDSGSRAWIAEFPATAYRPHIWQHSSFPRLPQAGRAYLGRKALGGLTELHFIGADIMDGFYGEEPLRWRFAMAEQAADMGIRVNFTGFSINREPTRFAIEGLRKASQYASLCVRDAHSVARLREVDVTRVEEVADIAFLIGLETSKAESAEAHNWLDDMRTRGNRVVAVNVNALFSRFAPLDDVLAAYERTLCALPNDVSLLMLGSDDRASGNDFAASASLANRMAPTRRTFVLENRVRAPVAASLLARCDLLFTGRMHAAILSLGGGTPAYCIDYQDKFAGTLDHFGLKNWVLPVKLFLADPETAAIGLEQHLAAAPAARVSMAGYAPRVRELARRNFRHRPSE
jgi:colanic acid/amylovoran biosynthesis protein